MAHFKDKEGKEFVILKEGESMPPGLQKLQFSSREEAKAFFLRLTATPEGREQLQRLMAEMGGPGDLFKLH